MIGQRDVALLLHAAQSAAESLQDRADEAKGQTLTLTVDEAAEIAEQFARVVAILKTHHLALADPGPPASRPRVA